MVRLTTTLIVSGQSDLALFGAMALLPPIELSAHDKLQVLRRLDRFRAWSSIDDKRYCLSCGKVISGRQIQIVGGTRGTGPLRAICPTAGCPSIPMDWVVPTEEVLAKQAAPPPLPKHVEKSVRTLSAPARRSISASLRRFATHFRHAA